MTVRTNTRSRPRTVIDPRIQKRRAEIHGDQGRHRVRVVVLVGSAAALLLAAWGITRTPLLAVDRVGVSGASRTPTDAVLAAGGIAIGRPMTDIDENDAGRRITRLPWVRQASVRRHWPRRVTVVVSERTASALAPAGGRALALVDATGRVLAPAPGVTPGLPLLADTLPAGPPGSRLTARARDVLRVAALLPQVVLSRVAAIAPSGSDEVEVRLRGSGVVRFGTPDRLGEKITALQTVLRQVDLQGLRVLDLRVPGTPVLTRQG